MSDKKFGALSSSANGQNLSATVSGLILGASSIVLFVAQLLDIPLAESDIATLAQQAGAVVASLVVIYGILRKVVLSVYDKYFRN